MGSTIVELIRSNHESIERYSRAVCEELDDGPRNYRDNTAQLHRVNNYLVNIVESSKRLIHLYEDKDGARKEEMNAMAGSGPNLLTLFYDRLKEVKEYHRKFPGVEVELPDDQIYVEDEQVLPQFTGEEAYGQCLDLHEYFDRFINLKGVTRVDYLTYLEIFSTFSDDQTYKTAEYKEYVKSLGNYLVDFLERSQPLLELDVKFKEINDEFETKWNSGEFKGWKVDEPAEKMEVDESKERDRERKERKEERKEERKDERKEERKEDRKDERKDERKDDRKDRDKERERDRERGDRKRDRDGREKSRSSVKKEKKERKEREKREKRENNQRLEDEKPVWCDACKKEFAKATVYRAHLTGKKHKIAENKLKTGKPRFEKNLKEVYSLEWKVHHIIAKLLMEVLRSTKTNIEKKQSKTWQEMKKEWEAEKEQELKVEKGEDSESEEEPEIKMTIDNYPVGWDGKPIPYWLYKLHGLGVEYKCEICGNTSYMGRKAYEKHFQEWRHAHGMRCLGIPNSKHFHDITKINDALQLWEKIKYDGAHADWKPEADEEFEDKEGNVFNKKTFEDLRRQNLL